QHAYLAVRFGGSTADPYVPIVSRSSAGFGDGDSGRATVRFIDGHGTCSIEVAFDSAATNLAPPDPDTAASEVLLAFGHNDDITNWQFGRVSVDAVTTAATAAQASSSADGRFVAFAAASDDIVPGDTNGKIDVFVR